MVLLGFFVDFFFYYGFKLPALILGDGPDIEFSPFLVWDKLHKRGVESKPKQSNFPSAEKMFGEIKPMKMWIRRCVLACL